MRRTQSYGLGFLDEGGRFTDCENKTWALNGGLRKLVIPVKSRCCQYKGKYFLPLVSCHYHLNTMSASKNFKRDFLSVTLSICSYFIRCFFMTFFCFVLFYIIFHLLLIIYCCSQDYITLGNYFVHVTQLPISITA